ncbi:hypothetical protein GOBAR_DD31579 [Gossypium barbadense]|nr:hypothetical protein GOBAR_DD31579 [Gossypium barbadense]
MAAFSIFVFLSGLFVTSSGGLYSHSIRPNFTASFINLVDNSGAFLLSPNATFRAAISNYPDQQLPQFYFSIIHSSTNTIIWTANRGRPIPSICEKIGFCNGDKRPETCLCPSAFHNGIDGCVPINPLLTLPKACNTSNSYGNETNNQVSYMEIGDAIDYFSTNFIEPLSQRISLLNCQLLCSRNCSCLGVLYGNSSGSCYPIWNNVGSIFSSTFGLGQDFSGYVKAMTLSSNINLSSKTDTDHKFSVLGSVLIPSLGTLVLVVLVIGFSWWKTRKWHSRAAVVRLGSKASFSMEIDLLSIAGLPVKFEYEELATATDNFTTQIGSGGFGTVYRGVLPDESVVAVKRITNLGVEGKKDFCTEIAIIGNIHHINLVKLKGFCLQGKQRFLVLEYMNKGSLDHVIFNNESVLEWKERFKIAVGTARGLAYLHSGCQHKIIHCDVKPENILLHEENLHQNLQVKVSDLGISKLLTPEQSNLLTTLRGTRGYLAPEWLTSSGISEKSDIFSYGMVLLEIVRGRRNFSIQPCAPLSGTELKRLYFPLLALEMHEQKRYMELVDPKLNGRAESEEVERLVQVALCCVQMQPWQRPTMSNVVGMLEGSLPVEQPRIESLNFLRIYGGRYASVLTTSTDGCNEQNEFIMDYHQSSNDC